MAAVTVFNMYNWSTDNFLQLHRTILTAIQLQIFISSNQDDVNECMVISVVRILHKATVPI